MKAVHHIAQYVPAAFVGAALPYLFRKEGLALNLFWLLAIPGYTRFFKFLLALLVDRYSFSRLGRRKSWIIPCTIIGVLFYLSLSFFPPDVQWIYVIVGILTFKSLVMAAQDIAVDAYAAESMTDEERPLGTTLINCLAGIAMAIGFAAVATVEAFNWAIAMIVASLLLIIAALPEVVRDEPPPPRAALIKKKDLDFNVLKSMRWSLFRRDSWYNLPFMFFWIRRLARTYNDSCLPGRPKSNNYSICHPFGLCSFCRRCPSHLHSSLACKSDWSEEECDGWSYHRSDPGGNVYHF